MSTLLQILIGVVKEHRDRIHMSPRRAVTQVKRIELHIEMTLSVDRYEVRKITMGMIARNEGQDEDKLREELIRSCYVSDMSWIQHGDLVADPDFEKMTIEIIDPTGILKWLGVDLFEQFKKAYNDEPLRLPSEDSRDGIS